jgi:hypothetical protein
MRLTSRFRRLVGLLMLTSPMACGRDAPAPPPPRAVELTGTTSERIAQVRRTLDVPPALAATILDANSIEERLGGGTLGPSDFAGYLMLRVSPGSLAQWRASLTPVPARPEPAVFDGPSTPVSWWVSRSDFPALQFFDAEQLTGRMNSWVGVHAASATIYIHFVTQ